MIEETAVVVAVDGNTVWLETQIKTTCGTCKAEPSCPTTTVAKAFSSKSELIELTVPCKLAVGQYVKIGIQEGALLKASALVYIAPLVAVIMCLWAMTILFPSWHELAAFAVSLGLAWLCYYCLARFFSRAKNKNRYAPVFLGATHEQTTTFKHEIPTHKSS